MKLYRKIFFDQLNLVLLFVLTTPLLISIFFAHGDASGVSIAIGPYEIQGTRPVIYSLWLVPLLIDIAVIGIFLLIRSLWFGIKKLSKIPKVIQSSIRLYLVFISVILIGLLATNYFTLLVIVLSMGAGIVSRPMLLKSFTIWRGWSWRKWVYLLIFAVVSLFSLPFSLFPKFGISSRPLIDEYKIKVTPTDSKFREFDISEQILINCKSHTTVCSDTLEQQYAVVFPTRRVTSSNRGFSLREVRINPLEGDSLGRVDRNLPNGNRLNGYFCQYRCPNAEVELSGVKSGLFYAAKNASGLEVQTYLETDRITWNTFDYGSGILFAYIRPPFQHFRFILNPFLGVESFESWLVALLGFIGGLILTPILKPVIYDFIKEKINSRIRKDVKKEKKTVTLIVSSDGTEKEIEVEENRKKLNG